MSDIDKVYTAETIDESPFPQEGVETFDTTQSSAKQTYSAEKIEDQPIPVKRIAVELLSSVLNTKSKKILGEIDFSPSGALQIGKYENGVSGDTRISANGIVMRNKAGVITLAQDGGTGDAVFAGQVRAGSTIVSNSIITEESSSGNGRTVYLIEGIPSIIIGDPR